MSQNPSQQTDSDDEPTPEQEPAVADPSVSPTLQSGIESTVVSGSDPDEEWSLGPVPNMPEAAPPIAAATDLRKLMIGAVIGDFQIQRVLGTGAFATVYLAVELSLSRFVALKVTADLGHEGRRMARLEHPNVVQVYAEQILQEEQIRLLSMQYVSGPTLQAALSQLTETDSSSQWTGADLLLCLDDHAGTTTTEIHPKDYAIRSRLEQMDHQQATCFLTAEIASGLHFAHSHDVLHRDIKPANILLNGVGRPFLVDFNLAEEVDDSSGRQGLIGGTLAYMSPEHLRAFECSTDAGNSVGPAADVYSLALVLVQMLTGELSLPTSESHTMSSRFVSMPMLRELRSRPLSFEFPQPTASQASLQAVIRRATDPNPDVRTSSAAVFSRELHSCQRLRRIETNAVMRHPVLKLAEKHSVAVFAALALVPQLIASVVNIAYNWVRVSGLPTAMPIAKERILESFASVTMWYNLLLWPGCLAIVAIVVRQSLRAIRMDRCKTNAEETAQRRLLAGLPFRMLQIAALGWLPGIVVFPIALSMLAAVTFSGAFIHFTLNFVTSTLLAMTYSYLGLSWLVTSVCWLRRWQFPSEFNSQTVSDELNRFSGGLKRARLAAGIVPLLSCLLLIATTAEPGEQYDRFRRLVMLLICLGMIGPLIANRIALRVSERLRIYAAE